MYSILSPDSFQGVLRTGYKNINMMRSGNRQIFFVLDYNGYSEGSGGGKVGGVIVTRYKDYLYMSVGVMKD